MESEYFLDSTKSIGANAMAEYLLAFIHMAQQRLDYESTFRFLRCALSPLTREQTDCLMQWWWRDACGWTPWIPLWTPCGRHFDTLEDSLVDVVDYVRELEGEKTT